MSPADEIIPRIWLGNRRAALDPEFIRKNNITVIVNATKNIPFAEGSGITTRKYRVPVDDNLENAEIANMAKWSPEIVYKVLKEYKSGATILVHCAAGMQRSAAIVAMLLIVLHNMTTDEAIQFIRSRRRIAFLPGPNFKRSIQYFEKYYKGVIIPSLQR
jgi:protein-tyrosine phosphatase